MRENSASRITGGHLLTAAALVGLLTAGTAPLLGAQWYLVLPVAFLAMFVLAICSFAFEAERRPMAVVLAAFFFPVGMWVFALTALVASSNGAVRLGCLVAALLPAGVLVSSLFRTSSPLVPSRRAAAVSPAE